MVRIEMGRLTFEKAIIDHQCECAPPPFKETQVKNVIEVNDEDSIRVYGVISCPKCVGTLRMTKISVTKKAGFA